MYVIVPDETAERRHANIANVTKRHCRIGKVSPKPPKHWLRGDLDIAKLNWPNHWTPFPSPFWSGGYVPVTSSGDVPIVPIRGTC